MQKIIKSAEESLDRVLRYYEDQGTPLSYRPKFKYVDGVPTQRPDALAMIREEFEFAHKYMDFFLKNFTRVIWSDGYKLEISDAAIDEICAVTKEKVGSFLLTEEYQDPEVDIFIFQPYKPHSREQIERDEIVAHEVWHLIEKERGVLLQHPFIVEGTATFANRKFVGQGCDIPIEDLDEFVMMMYLGAANVVQDYVETSVNPYLSMLDQSLRMQIQEDFLQRIRPVLVNSVKKTLEDEDNIKAMAHLMRQIPEFKPLEGNLTAAGILEAYKKMGAFRLVDELHDKDLEGLMRWFRLVGF